MPRQEHPCRCLAIGATAGIERQAGIRELSTPPANMHQPVPVGRTMRLRPGIDRPPNAGTRVRPLLPGPCSHRRTTTSASQPLRDSYDGTGRPGQPERFALPRRPRLRVVRLVLSYGRGDSIRLRRVAATLQVGTQPHVIAQLQVSQGLISSGNLDADRLLTFMTGRQSGLAVWSLAPPRRRTGGA